MAGVIGAVGESGVGRKAVKQPGSQPGKQASKPTHKARTCAVAKPARGADHVSVPTPQERRGLGKSARTHWKTA